MRFKPTNSAWIKKLEAWKEEGKGRIQPFGEDPPFPIYYARLCFEASRVSNEIDPATSVLFDSGNIHNYGLQYFKSCSPFISTKGNQYS
jgi:hypothetical protein